MRRRYPNGNTGIEGGFGGGGIRGRLDPTQPQLTFQVGCTISVIHFDESGSSRGFVT